VGQEGIMFTKTSKKQVTLLFSKYKNNSSSNCLCRVTSIESWSPPAFCSYFSMTGFGSPSKYWTVELNSIYGALLSASHFAHYSNFSFSA